MRMHAQVLNKRLDIIKELFDMLANELQNTHANKLEWIIIVLIMIEVVFQVSMACHAWQTWDTRTHTKPHSRGPIRVAQVLQLVFEYLPHLHMD